MRDLGIYFGTFAPCHVGHFEQIIRAKRENKHALVIVSGYEGDRGQTYGMTLENRVKAMRQLLANDDSVTVLKLNETDIPRYPHGWEPWLKMLAEKIDEGIALLKFDVNQVTYYIGEPEYTEPLQHFFGREWPDIDTQITMVDRKILGISGTSIREEPILNWDYVTRPFRRFFVQNVLVIGATATGKSSLVQDLARRYSTSYSADYVKTYLSDNKIENDELDVKDFHAMGTGQFEVNKKNIHSPETRKVFFADTDVMMTKIHMKMYADGEEFNQLRAVFDYFIQLQNWSLVLVLPPAGDQDVHASYNQRMHEMILQEIEDQQLNDLTHILDGESYREQYQEAHTLVDEILKAGKDN
ncbi:AAA family ATPase [Salinicoccus albus]|uniref:AAA family ATPase n=1 Tax=Salinicoccus albus TaxID=418756 RepID=UPI0003611E32|nr:AAA family ATPase [Salinicoccus albus]